MSASDRQSFSLYGYKYMQAKLSYLEKQQHCVCFGLAVQRLPRAPPGGQFLRLFTVAAPATAIRNVPSSSDAADLGS